MAVSYAEWTLLSSNFFFYQGKFWILWKQSEINVSVGLKSKVLDTALVPLL